MYSYINWRRKNKMGIHDVFFLSLALTPFKIFKIQ